MLAAVLRASSSRIRDVRRLPVRARACGVRRSIRREARALSPQRVVLLEGTFPAVRRDRRPIGISSRILSFSIRIRRDRTSADRRRISRRRAVSFSALCDDREPDGREGTRDFYRVSARACGDAPRG